ncbi:2-phosphosulfolactate phosphatase [Plantactinospora solaniradicis]|uniref:Probable 2-phosphosulfolactate phosphatase n=1 Tax=Plantactinospora solaniradicis TaxID=1723736 RepID=A0ABW1KRK3_9ACTN
MDAEVPTNTVVIVIDVIRAFTTAAVAFERGATEIVCAPSVEVGRDLRRLHPATSTTSSTSCPVSWRSSRLRASTSSTLRWCTDTSPTAPSPPGRPTSVRRYATWR